MVRLDWVGRGQIGAPRSELVCQVQGFSWGLLVEDRIAQESGSESQTLGIPSSSLKACGTASLREELRQAEQEARIAAAAPSAGAA